MPTPTKGPRLGGSPAHERLMLANLATSLFKHGKIQTTETKAKRLRPLAEQLITRAKRGDLHSRRRVLTVVRDKDVVFVKGIFEASEGLGALFAERGGELTISAPRSRERELDELLADLQNELQAHVSRLPLPAVP